MVNHFWTISPNMERIADVGFSPPKDFRNIYFKDEKLHLNAQASNVIVNSLSHIVVL
jgi:hypothetical protein